ncbi:MULTISPECIES: hypothetical protein [Bacillus]|nr:MULTISPECIES: hypothetical protein [Bacillus]MEB5655924.1 hypothetical protein [Bacillus anthracis]
MKMEMWKDEGTKRPIKRMEKKSNQGKEKNKKKQKEKLSDREIKDLMGMHRFCYERKRGTLRQE